MPEDYFRKKLTFEDVIELAKKGEELVWDDFIGFDHIETGSGLMINVYEIDEEFSLRIGGSGESTPLYIYLEWNADHEEHIDIRSEDVNAFLVQLLS